MASSVITGGRVKRRTKVMSIARAHAFAKALASNPRKPAAEIVVIAHRDKAHVEFYPVSTSTCKRLVDMEIQKRHERANEVKGYKWLRIGKRSWHCYKPDGQHYTQFLNVPRCTCPDWDAIHSIGGKCKHFLCAEMAERNWQRDHPVVDNTSTVTAYN